MAHPNRDSFYAEVFQVVREIPSGRVLTYGAIARLVGWPQHSRMVGRALRDVPASLQLPCHRVVNAAGRTAPDWKGQTKLLRREGVMFKSNGCVDLEKSLWRILEKDE